MNTAPHKLRQYISTDDLFKDLVPCQVIFIVNYNLTKRMHTSFKLITPQDNIILSQRI